MTDSMIERVARTQRRREDFDDIVIGWGNYEEAELARVIAEVDVWAEFKARFGGLLPAENIAREAILLRHSSLVSMRRSAWALCRESLCYRKCDG